MKKVDIHGTGIAPHNISPVFTIGADLSSAKAVLVMVHGRGASAESVLELSQYFRQEGLIFIAPQASGNLWYPYSFLMPIEQNEPGLTSSLQRITDIIDFCAESGIPEEKIMLLGFSQGASLSMEWAARSGRKIGALFGLSGGLIGPVGTKRDYQGSLKTTRVILGCSDIDPHIPKERVTESADVFRRMGAEVTMKLYPNMQHTVNEDEIHMIDSFIEQLIVK